MILEQRLGNTIYKPIPALIFGFIQSFIGDFKHCFWIQMGGRVGDAGHAGACSDAQSGFSERHFDGSDLCQNAQGSLFCVFGFDLIEDDGELFSAVTSREVVGSAGTGEGFADSAQYFIAHSMAVAIVDELEVIQVQQQQRKRLMIAFVAGKCGG